MESIPALRSGLVVFTSVVVVLFIIVLAFMAVICYRSLLRGRLARMRRIMWFTAPGLEEYGWYVELDGKRVAKLTPCYGGHGDFRFCYVLRATTPDPDVARDILDGHFWDVNWFRITFRSRLTNQCRSYESLIRGGFHTGRHGTTLAYFRNLGLLPPRTWNLWDHLASWKWRERAVTSRRRHGYSILDLFFSEFGESEQIT